MTILVTKIKKHREKTGMKQSELADLVHVRRETIVHLENGKYNPSLKLAVDISRVFNTTVEEMFEFQEMADSPQMLPEAKAEKSIAYKNRLKPQPEM